jgi:hypothetical protein
MMLVPPQRYRNPSGLLLQLLQSRWPTLTAMKQDFKAAANFIKVCAWALLGP